MLGTVFQDGYSFLSSASSGSVDKTEEALSRAIIGISKRAETKDANHAVVVLTGDSGAEGRRDRHSGEAARARCSGVRLSTSSTA